jgi:DNA polymerase III delta prime subunit/very-short-patch-repair endonuclease
MEPASQNGAEPKPKQVISKNDRVLLPTPAFSSQMGEEESRLAVLQRLEDSSKKLLDLTLRNKLVKFKPTKTMHVQLRMEELGTYTKILAEGEKKITLKPSITRPKFTSNWTSSEGTGKLEGIYTHGEDEDPERKLRNLLNEAKTFEGENGYSALFCAIGIIKWNEAPGAEFNEAPLLLQPVQLAKATRGNGFEIIGTGEPPVINPAIQLKLRDQSISLPDEIDVIDNPLESYVNSVEKLIAKKDWTIEPKLWLGMYKFHKFVMYKDLQALLARVSGGAALPGAVDSILDPDPNDPRMDRTPVVKESEIDDKIDWHNSRYILDADPSQIVAIEEVKAGKNLVIQGPPGTGKSQTIANLISELLGQNKSVLFVSEKEAALDVVKRRLDSAGLGNFCLALHGVKSSHDQFRNQMKPLLDGAFTIPPQGKYRESDHADSRTRLSDYAAMLRTTLKSTDLSIGWSINTLAALKQGNEPLSIIAGKEPLPKRKDLDEATRWISDRKGWAKSHGHAKEHAWAWSGVTANTPIDELDTAYQSIEAAIVAVREAHDEFMVLTDDEAPMSKDDLERIQSWKPELEQGHNFQGLSSANDLNSVHEFAQECLSSLSIILESKDELEARGIDWKSSLQAEPLRHEIEDLAQKFLFWLRPSYWKAKSSATQIYSEKPKRRKAELVNDLLALQEFQAQESEREQTLERSSTLQLGRTDWEGLIESLVALVSWLTHVLAISEVSKMPTAVVSALGDPKRATLISDSISKMSTAWKQMESALQSIDKLVQPKMAAPFGNIHDISPIVAKRLANWYKSEGRGTVSGWIGYSQLQLAGSQLWLNGLVHVEFDRIESDVLEKSARFAIADAIYRKAARDFPLLNSFDADQHEQARELFREQDLAISQHAAHDLCQDLAFRAKNVIENSYVGTPMHSIKVELQKKRRRKPIRQLVQETLPALRELKPCFMMSPITVSTYLPPDADAFDVLIFDEASQVKPEDALVCLMRGMQVVVVGDSKQLPPTSFFDAAEGDGEEEFEVLSSMESILDVCVANLFPEKMLTWHYRSRHHSLIEGSNQEFYSGRLLVFHSPEHESENLGLKMHYHRDSKYGEGGQGVNRGEAKEIAKMVLEHWEKFGPRDGGDSAARTLGVVAFSVAQAREIRQQVYEIAPSDAHFQSWVDGLGHEPFFIKNLENVQGDERDRIIVGVGYGFDANNNLRKQFGPVNKKGGERRLNVLFTRAREETIVVSNFKAGELNLQGIASYGPQVLKRFLDLAETGAWPETLEEGGETDSPFEDEVLEVLRRAGYQVTPQVGCAGFRIDLAVHDPNQAGRFCIAVECDGATYHSSPVARERDRQRQDVLERMGWTFTRVWSTDWFYRPKQAREKLLAAVAAAAENSGVQPKSNIDRANTSDGEYQILVDSSQGATLEFDPYEVGDYSVLSREFSMAEISPDAMAWYLEIIIQEEGPITQDIAAIRIRNGIGQGRMGAKAKEAFERGIQRGQKQGLFEVDLDGSLWMPNQEIVPRSRSSAQDALPIPTREIAAGLGVLVENAIEISMESAFQTLKLAFGIGRLTKDVQLSFEEGVNLALQLNKLTLRDDGVLVSG